MKQTLIINILNMENYLLTDTAQHSESSLNKMTINNLLEIHDTLVASLKSTDNDQ